MTELERVRGEIKLLQSKLEFLEELEKHKNKSPAEKAYKDWWGTYPSTEKSVSDTEDMRWMGFKAGYEAAQSKDVEIQEDVETSPTMFNCIIEGEPPNGYAAWNLWYENEGSKGILHNLRIAPIKSKAMDKLLHNDTDSSEYVKLPTLLEIIRDWNDDEDDPPCEVLVDMIADHWIFDEEEPFSRMDKFADGWNSYREKLIKNLK